MVKSNAFTGGVVADLTTTGGVLVAATVNNYAGTKLAIGKNTDAQAGVNIQSSPTGYGWVLFGDGTGPAGYVGNIAYFHTNNTLSLTAGGNLGLTIDGSGDTMLSGQLNIATAATPASAAAAGTTGDIAWDSGFIYVCTATNAWKRVAIATW
jgi:hypothetical protein